MHYHEKMKDLREKANLTQRQLGRLVGVSHSTISGYEHGDVGYTVRVAKKIVDTLAVVTGEKLTIDNVFFSERDIINAEIHHQKRRKNNAS